MHPVLPGEFVQTAAHQYKLFALEYFPASGYAPFNVRFPRELPYTYLFYSNSSGNSSNTANNGSQGSGSSGGSSSGSGGGANPGYATNVSGGSVVSYACQFVGNPYVWGGTSLTQGADCSGFVMSVFAHFGISLPHSSAALQGCGKEVSYANAQPGDLICYSGHVGIYMGGGMIVHAQSAAVGITTSSAAYRTIVTVRRVL